LAIDGATPAHAGEEDAHEANDDYLRWLYRGGHPNRFARLQNRASAIAFAAGIAPRRAAALEITGRRSGRVISSPVAIADVDGERYLISMLGANVNWVRNLTAAGGRAVPLRGCVERAAEEAEGEVVRKGRG
jgi:hypothetical protein